MTDIDGSSLSYRSIGWHPPAFTAWMPGGMACIRSLALNILRANGIQNVSQALYVNALNLDRLLALGSS